MPAQRPGGGGSSSVTASQITDAGTTGIALVQASTAAAARSTLSAASSQAERTTTYDFASSTGWTLTDNAGSASITGGVLRLTTTTTQTSDSGPRGHCDLGAVADPWAVQIAWRIAASSGGSSTQLQLRMILQSTSATTGASAKRLGLFVYRDGSIELKIFPVGGSAVSAIAAAPSSTLAYDGDDWLIVRLLGGVVSVWRARGSGGGHTLPARTSWVLLGYGSVAPTILSSSQTDTSPPVVSAGSTGGSLQAWDRLAFEVCTYAGTAVTYDVDDVSIVDLLA